MIKFFLKFTGLTVFALTLTLSFTSCSKKNEGESKQKQIKIVTTIFPEYDWIKNIVGECKDNYQIDMLLDNGTDLHNYQPTASDILKIANADLFVYIGGESDGWVKDALKESLNKNLVTLNLMEMLKSQIKEEEVVEGMEKHHHHHHDEDAHEHDEHETEIEYDEHVWLSLRNAQIVCSKIAESLAKIDPENSEVYKKNALSYNTKLDELDKDLSKSVEAAKNKTLLFGDRFPFRYLADDYGLKYFAAFTGCSAETEASFKTIHFLASKVDELNLSHICTIEKSSKKIAETIRSNTTKKDAVILELNSMQSITGQDAKNGASYLQIMHENIETLKQALN